MKHETRTFKEHLLNTQRSLKYQCIKSIGNLGKRGTIGNGK